MIVSDGLTRVFSRPSAGNIRMNQSASYNCPVSSGESYMTLRVSSDYPRPPSAGQSPEINMLLRGYEEIDEKKQLIDYGGDTDPIMPPSLGTIFPSVPSIVRTYKVHMWDGSGNRPSPDLESNWPVNLIGLYTSPDMPLVGPKAGRSIGGGNVLMLIFATQTTATFVHGEGDNPQDGYFLHIDNLCVDPNLLDAYKREDAAGRRSMPVIATGQIFGYGNGSDVRIAIRDSGDWMDPRARKDWWQGFDTLPPAPGGIINLPPPTGIPQPTNYIPQPISPTEASRGGWVSPTVASREGGQPTTYPSTPQATIGKQPTSPAKVSATAGPQKISPTEGPREDGQPIPSSDGIHGAVIPTPSGNSTGTTHKLQPTPGLSFNQKIIENPIVKFMKTIPAGIVFFLSVILP